MIEDQALRVLDLGCGSGILAVMMGLQRPRWKISALEVQTHLIDLARRNAESNRLDIDFIHADLRHYHEPEGFDLIVSNPPWLKEGSGICSQDVSREISRRELNCNMADVLSCLARNLRSDGQALVLYPVQRQNELEQLAGNYLLDIIQAFPSADTNKYLIFHIKTQGKTP